MRTTRLLGMAAVATCLVGTALCWCVHPTRGGETHSPNSPPADAPRAGGRTVHALGRLEPTGTVLEVAAPAGNEGDRLEALLVNEGDRVRAGDLIGTMDTYARRLASVEQEQARLAMTTARLRQVKAGNKGGDIEAARAVVSSAEFEVATLLRDRERCERLKRNSAISEAELDNSRLAHERAVALLRQANGRLEAIREVRSVDVEVAEADVQLAAASLELAQANLKATRILAPSDGTILRIHARPGERVFAGGILEMGRIDRMQAVAEVFEGDLPGLAIGDAAVVVLDATGHRVDGRVREIGFMVARKTTLTNDPVSDTDARVVEVRIDLESGSLPWLSRLSNARVQISIMPANVGAAPTEGLDPPFPNSGRE